MRRIAFVGAGRLAHQFAAYLAPMTANGNCEWIYFGDPSESGPGFAVLPFDRHIDALHANCEFYVALGYHQLPLKRKIVESLRTLGRSLPPLVHATAYVHPSVKLGAGCVVYPGCVVGPNCVLESGALLNTAVVLAHDVTIGEATYISPSVTASGFSKVGAECFLGTGTLIANDVTIGAGSCIGIGSVVTRSLPNGTRALGNPLREATFKIT